MNQPNEQAPFKIKNKKKMDPKRKAPCSKYIYRPGGKLTQNPTFQHYRMVNQTIGRFNKENYFLKKLQIV